MYLREILNILIYFFYFAQDLLFLIIGGGIFVIYIIICSLSKYPTWNQINIITKIVYFN